MLASDDDIEGRVKKTKKWDWQKEAEEKLKEQESKPKRKRKLSFDERLALVERGMHDLFPDPTKERGPRLSSYLQGANAWHGEGDNNPQPKPKTAQDKLKELFGDNSE